jgi:hypothetical protein
MDRAPLENLLFKLQLHIKIILSIYIKVTKVLNLVKWPNNNYKDYLTHFVRKLITRGDRRGRKKLLGNNWKIV